jgi:hypothetical protein
MAIPTRRHLVKDRRPMAIPMHHRLVKDRRPMAIPMRHRLVKDRRPMIPMRCRRIQTGLVRVINPHPATFRVMVRCLLPPRWTWETGHPRIHTGT